MNDLILRQAAIDVLRTCYDTETITYTNGNEYINYEQAVDLMGELPSAEPDRKKGKWIDKPNIYGVAYCSECDYELHTDDTNYCPNCGADMRGEQHE